MTSNQNQSPAPSRLRRGVVAASLVAGGFVVGIGSFAVAAPGGMPWGGPWHRHHGPHIGMIQHVVRNALDNVGATTVQEDKIHDIIAAAYTDFEKDKPAREAMRKQVLDLLKAPTIDRAAIDKLRSEKAAEFDARSKAIANALVDAAGQLTPDQRAKLVERFDARMAHGGWDHGPHGNRMDPRGGPEGAHGPSGEHGPDDHG